MTSDDTRPLRLKQAAEFKDRPQDLKETIDHGLHTIYVVSDIVEVRSHFSADAGEMPTDKLSDQFGHSTERALEAREFASQTEYPGDFFSSEKAV